MLENDSYEMSVSVQQKYCEITTSKGVNKLSEINSCFLSSI